MLAPDAFMALRQNVSRPRIDLCLAVDAIDGDLRRLVEYLNTVTEEEINVTALQLSYARHDQLEILIPTTFGGEIAAAKSRPIERKTRWNEQSFLAALATETNGRLFQNYLNRARDSGQELGRGEAIWWGEAPGGGVFLCPLGAGGHRFSCG
jgi:hypothetical protein